MPLVLGAADASVAAMPLDATQAAGLIWAGIGGERLLDEPFYRRWEAGTLASGELAYAEQYRHIEAALPQVLRRVASNLPDGPARAAVHANLADELGRPATRSLTALQLSAAASDPVRGLGVLAAYETQAVAVAVTKAAGLRRHYGIDGRGVAFWDVHADLEADHAGWTGSALAATAASPAQVTSAAADGARAWWQFLDERQTAA